MTYYFLVQGTDKTLQKEQMVKDNRLDPVLKINKLDAAERLLAAEYFAKHIKLYSRQIEESTVLYGVPSDKYRAKWEDLVEDYKNLSAKEFLQKRDMYVVEG